MDVRVEGQVVDAPEQGDVAAVLQKALSGKKFKSVVAARVTAEGTETLCDLSATVPAQCTDITPVYADSPEGLSMIRHSTAHVMAAAVKKLYPSAKVTIGPAVENGFYYDFDVEKPFSSEDFPAIEAEMQRIVNERLPFVRTTMSKADAIEKFSKMGENFKVEIIEGIEGDTVSLYTCGDFTDLCRGPTCRTPASPRPARSFPLPAPTGAATKRIPCSPACTAPPLPTRRPSTPT